MPLGETTGVLPGVNTPLAAFKPLESIRGRKSDMRSLGPPSVTLTLRKRLSKRVVLNGKTASSFSNGVASRSVIRGLAWSLVA